MIRDRPLARHPFEQRFESFGMAPGQQAIQVSDLRVQFVVSLRADCDNAVGANRLDILSHLENAAVGDFLAIAHLHEGEFSLRGCVHKNGRNDERTKIIAFAGLIDADAFDGLVIRLVRHR